MSVSEIGLSSELELITFSFGIGTIFALFDTSGTFPTFRDTLNIFVIVGANSAAYVFHKKHLKYCYLL